MPIRVLIKRVAREQAVGQSNRRQDPNLAVMMTATQVSTCVDSHRDSEEDEDDHGEREEEEDEDDETSGRDEAMMAPMRQILCLHDHMDFGIFRAFPTQLFCHRRPSHRMTCLSSTVDRTENLAPSHY